MDNENRVDSTSVTPPKPGDRFLDLNDDGKVDFKDFLILGGTMIAGYFVVKFAIKKLKLRVRK